MMNKIDSKNVLKELRSTTVVIAKLKERYLYGVQNSGGSFLSLCWKNNQFYNAHKMRDNSSRFYNIKQILKL